MLGKLIVHGASTCLHCATGALTVVNVIGQLHGSNVLPCSPWGGSHDMSTLRIDNHLTSHPHPDFNVQVVISDFYCNR